MTLKCTHRIINSLCHCLTMNLMKNRDSKAPPMPLFPECEVDEELLKMRSVSHGCAENIDFNFFFDIRTVQNTMDTARM